MYIVLDYLSILIIHGKIKQSFCSIYHAVFNQGSIVIFFVRANLALIVHFIFFVNNFPLRYIQDIQEN